ncbi:DUF6231 family protein [Salinisphaera hydrothermalis]|uniref:DUF6231 family protein n=1 Tax=Salinisphaera hydrothermalis TaxID=563188 RepID=UPI0033420D26
MSLPDDIQQCLREQIAQHAGHRCVQFAPRDCLTDWTELGVENVALEDTLASGHERERRSHPARLAIVINAPRILSRRATEQLLGRLRNYGTGEIIAAFSIAQAREHDRWSTREFLGLGFRRLRCNTPIESHYWLYRYAIHDYKITPDWLNSRHWANPEQWDKHRW